MWIFQNRLFKIISLLCLHTIPKHTVAFFHFYSLLKAVWGHFPFHSCKNIFPYELWNLKIQGMVPTCKWSNKIIEFSPSSSFCQELVRNWMWPLTRSKLKICFTFRNSPLETFLSVTVVVYMFMENEYQRHKGNSRNNGKNLRLSYPYY